MHFGIKFEVRSPKSDVLNMAGDTALRRWMFDVRLDREKQADCSTTKGGALAARARYELDIRSDVDGAAIGVGRLSDK